MQEFVSKPHVMFWCATLCGELGESTKIKCRTWELSGNTMKITSSNSVNVQHHECSSDVRHFDCLIPSINVFFTIH